MTSAGKCFYSIIQSRLIRIAHQLLLLGVSLDDKHQVARAGLEARSYYTEGSRRCSHQKRVW